MRVKVLSVVRYKTNYFILPKMGGRSGLWHTGAMPLETPDCRAAYAIFFQTMAPAFVIALLYSKWLPFVCARDC